MRAIEELEARVWQMIEEATLQKDSGKLQTLGVIAQETARLKEEYKAITLKLDNLQQISKNPNGRHVLIPITAGSIKQNYLSITIPKRVGLLPNLHNALVNVETSAGFSFKTTVLHDHNRLQERGEIARFYREANVRAGDKVIWKEVVPGIKYFLGKATNESA